ncbi:hypothetical protein GX51_04638 [Blastomyces parvus]|uniref:Uncharacterized protein n=1 Tax=Blastomyces parvus TaxID=2060905 RepID=A0A2B7X0V8_9EURO|nr:hypothetical protein GX51_04638 [Blastomyces parvus]
MSTYGKRLGAISFYSSYLMTRVAGRFATVYTAGPKVPGFDLLILPDSQNVRISINDLGLTPSTWRARLCCPSPNFLDLFHHLTSPQRAILRRNHNHNSNSSHRRKGIQIHPHPFSNYGSRSDLGHLFHSPASRFPPPAARGRVGHGLHGPCIGAIGIIDAPWSISPRDPACTPDIIQRLAVSNPGLPRLVRAFKELPVRLGL